MTPEQQRIAIAEACGWKVAPYFSTPLVMIPPSGQGHRVTPNYPGSLDLMHEAEGQWIEAAPSSYERSEREAIIESHLSKILGPTRSTFRATAAQRAEAFLRTLNLWQP